MAEQVSELLQELKKELEALFLRVSVGTGLEPPYLIALAVVAATLFLFLVTPRRPRLSPPPRGGTPEIPKKPKQLGEITLQELAQYDGSDPNKPICVAVKGNVFDVSRAKHLYGPDGGYSAFAGKDASRALAKMSMDPVDAVGDLTGLTASEVDTLAEWEAQYQFKYEVVGKLVPAVGRPDTGSS